jgi:hypothetical protein
VKSKLQRQINDSGRTGDLVPSGLLQRKCGCGQHTVSGGECDECGKKQMSLQRATSNTEHRTANAFDVPPIVHDVLGSPGHKLDVATRGLFKTRFGHDFSQVRLHSDAPAAESARAVNALAYTVGPDIVFGSGQFAPHTKSGRHLLAHELTHVIQQEGSRSGLHRSAALQIDRPDDQAEREADAIANQFASTGTLELPRIHRPVPIVNRRGIENGPDEPRRPSPLNPFSSTLPYREANELAKCIQIMGEASRAYCREVVLGEKAPPPIVVITRDGGEADTFISTDQLSFTAQLIRSSDTPGNATVPTLFNWTVTPQSPNAGNGNPHTGSQLARFTFTPNPARRQRTGSRQPNDPIKYRVSAAAGGGVGSLDLTQDETDIIRQEYIDLGPVVPPPRSNVVAPTIATYNTGNYDLIVDGGMDNALGNTESQFQTLTPAQAQAPAIGVSSGFRNPRRNVAAGSQFPVGSKHVWGRALDLTIPGANATLWARLRQAGANAGNTSICEDGPTQLPCNKPNVDHVHIQWE